MGCFFAAAGGAAAWAAAAAGERGADVAAAAGWRAGSGVMMLTGGVDAALGKSALVGLPVGIDGGRAATAPGIAATGVFQFGA